MNIDALILGQLVALRMPFLTYFFKTVTTLGDARVITIVVLSLLYVLWRHRRYAYKVGMLFALFGSLAAGEILKFAIQRSRPDESLALIAQGGYSYPSMHSATAMAVYGFLAYMIVKLMHPPHHRSPVIAILLLVILLVGMSRIYLGVHYPSDVLGGYALGFLFAYLGVRLTRFLEQRDPRASRGGRYGR